MLAVDAFLIQIYLPFFHLIILYGKESTDAGFNSLAKEHTNI